MGGMRGVRQRTAGGGEDRTGAEDLTMVEGKGKGKGGGYIEV